MKIKNLLKNASLLCFLASSSLFGQVPVANFSVNPNPGCIGTTYTVTDLSTNTPTAWSYTFTGGVPATSTVKNPTVNFAAAGIHTITLIASNGSGASLPVVKTVTVFPTPTLNINPPGAQACFGSTVSANFFGSGASTYTWSTGANTASVSILTPSTTTTYTLNGTGVGGCAALPKTVTYTVNPLPTVSVTANPTVACGPSTTTLTANAGGAGPFTYSWSPAGGTNSVATVPIPTTYSVAITDSKGCKTTGTITVVNGTIPTLTVMPLSVTICQGQSAALTTTGTCTSFTWNTGANTSSISVTPSVTTNYTVTGYNGQCTRTATRTVNVLAATPITVSSSNSLICVGQSATLTATPSGTVSVLTYSWMPTGGTTSVAVVSPTTSTTYTVLAINSNSCVSGNIFLQNVSTCIGVQQIDPVTPNFGIFPNPNNGEFTISLSQLTGSTFIEIYNNLGQLVERDQLYSVNSKITLLREPDGIYHVKVIQDGKLVYKTKMAKTK